MMNISQLTNNPIAKMTLVIGENLSEFEKALSEFVRITMRDRYHVDCFIFGTYPTKTLEELFRLIKNINNGLYPLFLTTHNYFVIPILANIIQATSLYEKASMILNPEARKNSIERLNRDFYVPEESRLHIEDLNIFEANENELKKLEHVDGLPTDEFCLNKWMEKLNMDFDLLLEEEDNIDEEIKAQRSM